MQAAALSKKIIKDLKTLLRHKLAMSHHCGGGGGGKKKKTTKTNQHGY